MGKYSSDRGFTDKVHELAVKIIYRKMHWKEREVDEDFAEEADIHDGIDYFAIDTDTGRKITIQERFREEKYGRYNDCTLRYERERNAHEERKRSEFYKIKADYLVYGIINSSKDEVHKATDFLKYVVVDLKKLQCLINCEAIVISKDLSSNYCKRVGGRMFCPVNYNPDGSSSFVPFDVKMLDDLFGPLEIVVDQRGYLE